MRALFVCYGPLVTMAGGVPVYVADKKNEFRLCRRAARRNQPEDEACGAPLSRNPTGGIMEARLEALVPFWGSNINDTVRRVYASTYGVKHT